MGGEGQLLDVAFLNLPLGFGGAKAAQGWRWPQSFIRGKVQAQTAGEAGASAGRTQRLPGASSGTQVI